MLILPIINKRRVMNVEIKLKDAMKVRKGVSYDDASASDIIVNREKFSESSFKNSKNVTAPIDFIRSKSLLYPRRFLVTTKVQDSSSLYDVYEVPQPPKKSNESIDKLYSKAITDMRKEIPNRPKRGRYVSFEDLGFNKQLTNDKIALLQRVVKESCDSNDLGMKLQSAGIADLVDTADFISNFECTILSDTEIPEDSLQDTLKAMSSINTRDYRNLKKYYNMAKSNTDLYTKISYVNKIIYDKPLVLHRSLDVGQKTLIKKKDNYDYQQAA